MNSKLSAILFLSFLSLSLLTFHIPAVESFEVHDVAVTDVTVFPECVFPGVNINTYVTVENQGTSTETFNVTLCADNSTAQVMTVTNLPSASNTTLTFQWKIIQVIMMIFPPPWWNLTGVLYKNLTMKAEAGVVSGEVDTADNVYVDGLLQVVWMVGDVTGDGKVDMRDIAMVARAFGSSPGDPHWDPMVDFNSDEKVDMRDVGRSARLFGTQYG